MTLLREINYKYKYFLSTLSLDLHNEEFGFRFSEIFAKKCHWHYR